MFAGRGNATGYDVEMDAVNQVELRDQVEAAGLRVVRRRLCIQRTLFKPLLNVKNPLQPLLNG